MFSIPREWPDSTVVILGGGPSLTPQQIESARRFRRIAVNWAYTLDLDADVLTFGDPRFYTWSRFDLHRHRGKYKMTWRSMQPATPGLELKRLMHRAGPPHLSTDPRSISANNSGQGAINIAYHFGARRILLLGFDMKVENGSHNWHALHKAGTDEKRYRTMFGPAIKGAGEILKKKGVEVINCTPGSALTCFPFQRIEEID